MTEQNIMYAVYDQAGDLVRQGQCPLSVLDAQADQPGYVAVEVKERVPEPVQALSYKQLRKNQYPLISDQLDTIWKTFLELKQQGVSLGEEGDTMLGQIQQVKQSNPKL